jgi:HSP20 family molecular chaperone IbpA
MFLSTVGPPGITVSYYSCDDDSTHSNKRKTNTLQPGAKCDAEEAEHLTNSKYTLYSSYSVHHVLVVVGSNAYLLTNTILSSETTFQINHKQNQHYNNPKTMTKIIRFIAASALAVLALVASHPAAAIRSHCDRGGVPNRRHYNYSRRPRDVMDLVSDVFTVPIYFNSLLRQQEAQLPIDGTTPRYAISESEEGVVELTMEVSGASAKDVTVEIENGNMIRIHGSRNVISEHGVEELEFDKVFEMEKDIDMENIKVTLSAGILRITAPKKERAVKRIPVVIQEEETDEIVEEVVVVMEDANTKEADDPTITED